MNGKQRENIRPGIRVAIVLKQDQRTGKLTEGIVKDLLTNSKFHPHGIKVRLTDGQVALTPSVQAVVFTRLTGRLSPNRGWHRKVTA